MRVRLTKLQRIRIFDAADGRCIICGLKIHAERGEDFDIDHERPLAFGGADDESNLRPLHKHCHQIKTAIEHQDWTKADRIRAKHLGIKSEGSRRWRTTR